MYSTVTKSQYKLITLKSQCEIIIPLIQNRDVRTITLVLFSQAAKKASFTVCHSGKL